MATTSTFPTPEGLLVYPKILAEDAYMGKGTGKHTAYIWVKEDDPETQAICKMIEGMHETGMNDDPRYAKVAARNWWSPIKPAMRKGEDGLSHPVDNTISFKATTNMYWKNGELKPPVPIVDAQLEPFDLEGLVEIPNNTRARLAVQLDRYVNGSIAGIAMRLQSVQIIQLGQGGYKNENPVNVFKPVPVQQELETDSPEPEVVDGKVAAYDF